MAISVTLLGATGLVGGHTLDILLAAPEVDRVVVVGRRSVPDPNTPGASSRRLVQRVLDMHRLADHADAFASDAVICALGTTMKQAGSRDAFRRVDHDIPLEAARIALAQGAGHYLLVSALGANLESRVFYNRVKGEVERGVLSLRFRTTTIVRPSLLLGEREDVRIGEQAAKFVGWLVPGRLRPVLARDVARVLVHRALAAEPGARVVESEEVRALAARIMRGER